ncbi:hypothetical protein SORBI_3008G067800 [Sorghum bicolor]|uniref:Uncharacterized protein n=1 Tax=Sorghum bicolor TaxID=4558 RepID=A0A1Z5R531_SORBI|nr:hypothetical protein SORBI_3008G067800 [Sorghum bicolor]
MSGTMVSASTGAMNSLLGKLTTLMGKEYGKLKGVHKEMKSLEEEFRSMKALLEKLADMDDLDAPAKEWRNQVRHMSYDIEDCIDDFIHHFEKNDATKGLVKKTARLLKKLRVRHQIASKIQEIKIRVEEISKRRMRYKLDDYTSKPSYVPVDPRVLSIYAEAAGLVGIDVPTVELTALLMGEEQDLRVASIVGFGGLGKTTLANQVYRKLEGNFKCRAFVTVSQKPDILKLLNKILIQIGGSVSHTSELDDLLKKITEQLQDKRYFIVIDDLWDSSTWNVIKCAFPANNCGSRVLTTTRIYSIAFACCCYSQHYVYNMRPLADILKRCGGLPLAIISIASLLAGQSKMAWEYVWSSLGSMFKGNPCLEDMKHILDLSYRNLPHHLKTCLLYVGMYPEDSIINKDDLVRQWIAEGFVSRIHGLDEDVVAGSYFNELMNMSMIQPVNTDYNGEVLSCKVHDIMLDLITVKSAEENFFDIIDGPQATMSSHKKVRRASIQYNGAGHDVALTTLNGSLCQVRSVVAFTRVLLPSFQECKYLRVLFVEFKEARTHKMDLTSICGLFLLRYLKIVTDGDLELPNQFWGLQYLDTMVLESPMKLYIPSDIVRLCRLLHLIVPGGMVFQDGIGSLKFLRTLQEFDFSRSSLESFQSLDKLTNLRDLQLYYDRLDMDEMTMEALYTLLEGLPHCSNLKSFVINSHIRYFDWLSRLSGFPCHIQRLHLWGLWFPRIPKWISQLHDLYNLELVVQEVVPNNRSFALPCTPLVGDQTRTRGNNCHPQHIRHCRRISSSQAPQVLLS